MKKMLLAAVCGLTAIACVGVADAAREYGLKPPFDVQEVRAKTGHPDNKEFSCEAPPAPMRDIQVESFYSNADASASVVDPEKYAAYKAASKPASTFEVGLESTANRYVRSNPPRPELAACVLKWLDTWAQGGALLGSVNKNGEYTRKWLLGSVASAYMQIRGEPSLDPEKKKHVTAWMRQVADVVRNDFSRDAQLKSRQNNHLFWAAWSVGAAGMALNDDSMFRWAIEKEKFGINSIQADGTLPTELARGRRAYLYHLFAAMPLFMLAEAADRNGVDLFHENNDGLKRLGEVSLKNLGNPAYFAKLTGEQQDLTHVGTPSDLGWVEIYRQHYQDPKADAALREFRPMKQSRFGGNITLLYSQIYVKGPEKPHDKAEDDSGDKSTSKDDGAG
jgi:poly(beta-D-mannuronate) lyase